MHEAGILDAVRERASRSRGGVAVFDRLNPRQTAHIVVDLQNGFMDHGQVAEVPMARTIVPNVNRISAALRAAGGVVIYTQHTADAEAVRTWSVFFEHFCGPERRARFIETFTPGSPGHALWPELDVDGEDRSSSNAASVLSFRARRICMLACRNEESIRSSFPARCRRSAAKPPRGMR